MSIIAKFYGGPVSAAIPLAASASVTLPDDKLHITGGNYLFQGVAYDCTQPGLYRWFDLATGLCRNRLVWSADLYGYFAGVAWHHKNGPTDEALSLVDLQVSMRKYTMIRRCGPLADFAMSICSQAGVAARKVQAITAEPLNGWDDGHIVFEAKPNNTGQWKLWDLNTGCYFTDSNGVHLDLAGIISLGIQNCTLVRIAQKYQGDGRTTNVDYGLITQFMHSTEEEVRAWVNRIYQTVVYL